MVGPETNILPDEKIILAGNITIGNFRLSEHFTLWEFIRSGGHPKLVEVPHPLEILYMEQFARNALEPLREFTGTLNITSGHRGSLLNREVGGVENSIHQIIIGGVIVGVATDIVPANVSAAALFGLLPDLSRLPISTAIYYSDRQFVHLDNRPRNKRYYAVSDRKGHYDEMTEQEVRSKYGSQ